MDSDQAPEKADGGILAGLLAPLRLPERALKALDSLAAASEHLGPMREDITRVRKQTEPVRDLPSLVKRISKQAEPLAELLPALERLEAGLSERLERVEESLGRRLEPVGELLPALDRLQKGLGKQIKDIHQVVLALEGDESHLNKTVGALAEEIAEMHKTIIALQDDVQRATDRLPDPDAPGPLAKARDVLTDPDSPGPLAKARDVLTGGGD